MIKYGGLSCPDIRESALAHRLVTLTIECSGFLDSAGYRWLRQFPRKSPDHMQALFLPLKFMLRPMNAALALEARDLRRRLFCFFLMLLSVVHFNFVSIRNKLE